MPHVLDSRYCYYHEKQASGAIDFCQKTGETTVKSEAGNEERTTWRETSPLSLYPVWPLPKSGYVLIEREDVAA